MIYCAIEKVRKLQKIQLLIKNSIAKMPESTLILIDVRVLVNEIPNVVTKVAHNEIPPKHATSIFAFAI
jgi:hypothetical protein